MESIDPLWVFGGIALLAGGLLGALICRRFTPTISDVDELRVKLERSRSEMETYRASVNSHFSKTSDLVKDLTEDYVKVYRHLSEGAQNLSDAPEFSHVLEQQKGRVLISTDEDIGLPDLDVAKVEEAPVQDREAADPLPEVPGPGAGVGEDDADEEALTDADVFEPTDKSHDDGGKTVPGSAPMPDPTARTDTQ
jgi:uncharacterized membrane-anchored protein YhcB (DUF1043 family)